MKILKETYFVSFADSNLIGFRNSAVTKEVNMYNPCETCYIRFGHSYTEECDEKCNYAATVKKGTCRNIGDEHNLLHQVDQFVCSECTIHLEGWHEIYYDYDYGIPPSKDFYEYVFEYCPNCGRKIIE